jgi:hypothetical protein
MEKHNYKFYRDNVEKWKQIDFDLCPKEDLSVAHLICEGKKLSKLGIGGEAFRHWVSGLFKDGVYLYVDNYKIGIRCTEDPKAKLHCQCNNPCSYGDPWPQPSSGDWADEGIFTGRLKAYIDTIVKELCQEIYDVITARAQEIEAELEKEFKIAIEKNKNIKNAWELVAK